jgi:hypothetical protein
MRHVTLQLIHLLTEVSTRKFLGRKTQPTRNPDNLTAIYEPIE